MGYDGIGRLATMLSTVMGYGVKINGSGPVGSTKGAGRRRNTGGAGGGFASALDLDGTESTASLGGTGPISSLSSLLALQETPDATAGPSRGRQRAEDLLAGLEDLRRGLILGSIPVAQLRLLADRLGQRMGNTGDPRLDGIIGEIELRVAVELAKLGFDA